MEIKAQCNNCCSATLLDEYKQNNGECKNCVKELKEMEMPGNKSMHEVLENVELVLSLADKKVEAYILKLKNVERPSEKCGTTLIAKDIEKTTGFSFSFVFPLVSAYVNGRKDVKSCKGPNGGLQLVKESSANGEEL